MTCPIDDNVTSCDREATVPVRIGGDGFLVCAYHAERLGEALTVRVPGGWIAFAAGAIQLDRQMELIA